MNPGDWAWNAEHEAICRVIDVQTVWDHTLYRVWLPTQNAVMRVSADRLTPLDAHSAILNPHHLSYTVTAARIADALAQDVLVAPLEAPVIPLPHQIRALQRAISGDRVRYLLADEVGLGKTIEAGLILRQLKLRGLVRRALVIAPKGLVTQWVSEMRTHFNEDFHPLIPGDFAIYRSFVREDNLWRAHDQVICSMDSVKPIDGRRGWSREQVAEYNRQRFDDLIAAGWDLIIVDEAHRLGGSTDQVARYRLGQGLAEAALYLLLLTATPHQGKTDAFHRLMGLLDPGAFPDSVSVTRERVQPYVIRTEKRQAIDLHGQPIPCLRLPGLPKDLSGFWSMWRIALRTEGSNRQRVMPLFLHDDERLLLPTARRIWDLLLTDSPEGQGYLSGSEAIAAFDRQREVAEVQGKSEYEELVRLHRARLSRERDKGAYAFEARRRALDRIGLPTVRARRLALLEREERAWREQLERQADVMPDLVPLIVLRIVTDEG